MATSGSTSVAVTKYDTLKFSWSLTSQSVANNNSKISWKMELVATSYGRINSSASKSWSVTVNGTNYSGTNTVGISNNSTKTLASGTTTIGHNADGTKTFSYSFSQSFTGITFSGVALGTSSGSGSGTLTTIARASAPTLSVNTQYIGSNITIYTNRASTSFTHTIRCGWYNNTSTIATGVGVSYTWTIPTSFYNNLPNATSGWGTLYLDTYSGSTLIGTKTITFTAKVNTSTIKPSQPTYTAVEAGGIIPSSWGVFVQNKSKLKITTSSTPSAGSGIATYKVKIDGKTYTGSPTTTDFIKSSGNVSIQLSATDGRGVTTSATRTVSIVAYTEPTISTVTATRCNSDGTANDKGTYLKISLNASVSSVSSKNKGTYKVLYKKTTESTWTTHTFSTTATTCNNSVTLSGIDTNSSYDVKAEVTDLLTTEPVTKFAGGIPTSFTTVDYLNGGHGMAIGKVAEEQDTLDINFGTRLRGGLIPMLLEAETNLNDIKTVGWYIGENLTYYGYQNLPQEFVNLGGGTFDLKVTAMGDEGQRRQILTTCFKDDAKTYERQFYSNAWGNWHCTSAYGGFCKLLWDGDIKTSSKGYWMTASQTITLPEKISEQHTGIILVFCDYSTTTSAGTDSARQSFVVLKSDVAKKSGVSRDFLLTSNPYFDRVGAKHIYITDTQLTGIDQNSATGTGGSGIKYQNGMFVLHYIYGF